MTSIAPLSRQLASKLSEKRFQEIVELASEGIVMVDAAARISFANPRIHSMLGYEPGSIEGRHATDFVALGYTEISPIERQATLTPVINTETNEEASSATHRAAPYRLIHRDGHTVDVLISAATITDDDNRYAGAVGMVTDVTELRRTERALHESAQQLGVVLAAVDESIWQLNLSNRELKVSPTFNTSLGYSDNESPRCIDEWSQRLHPDDIELLLAIQKEGGQISDTVHEVTYRIRHKNGDWRWILGRYKVTQRNVDGRPHELTGTNVDITKRKHQELELINALSEQRELNRKLEEAQNQLLQSEKMASLGQLAAGVAHELNNPIGFIQSNLSTLAQYLTDIFSITTAYTKAECESGIPLSDLSEIHKLKKAIDFKFLQDDIALLIRESLDGIDRVTKIVRDLKDFSRVGEANWQWANIHEGLDSTLNIVRNEVKYKANVTKHYGQLPKIYCLPSQLNQVFMNLLVNAAHAIPERGDIIITTRMATEHTVQIEISDSGTGMHPETIQHIFEPFFTTKGVGKGTGLGLSIAYGIIAKHHGRIEVESHVGRGTTFTITLSIRPPEAVELPSPELDNPVGN